jgi:hypothetical protein
MKKLMLILAVLLVATAAQATPIAIANHSFEAQTLSNGSNDAFVNGWGQTSGPYVYNPTSSQFSPVEAPDGQNVAVINPDSNGAFFYQDLSTAFEEGKTYTMTVSVSRRLDHTAAFDTTEWQFGLGLDTSASMLASTSGTIAAGDAGHGVWTDFQVVYTATAADDGVGIRIRLKNIEEYLDGGAYDSAVAFDNVRLDVVPEPATMSLLGIGGLLALVRRKR